jgi:hypothetical protein
MIDWKSVSSRAINRIAYDRERSLLFIDFKDSTPQYTYRNVPEKVFFDFLAAPSKGTFYHRFIKDRYSF